MNLKITLLAATLLITSACGYRHVRVADDITPGSPNCVKLDWRYGAGDIRIQTTKVLSVLMDRWITRTGWQCQGQPPRIVITDIDNRTDCYISDSMIRDIFEGVAVNDHRFVVVVGDACNEAELDYTLQKFQNDPKYANSSTPCPNQATAPQFLAKVRLTKASTEQPFYTLQDWRMTITLYDIETQEVLDSYWDVLSKKVYR